MGKERIAAGEEVEALESRRSVAAGLILIELHLLHKTPINNIPYLALLWLTQSNFPLSSKEQHWNIQPLVHSKAN